MALRVRRVITGHDGKGKAVVKIDEVAQHLFTGRPGVLIDAKSVEAGGKVLPAVG